MRRLREANPQKFTELWKKQLWNTAPAHTSMLVREFKAKNRDHIGDRIHRSWFPLIKGKRFATIEEIRAVGDTKRPFQNSFED